MLPPQTAETGAWAERLRTDVPEIRVLEPRAHSDAQSALADADAAYGTLPEDLIGYATRLRWLQAPAAGPAPGFYHQALVAHPVVVTNMRGTYTAIVASHAATLLLALARDLPRYAKQQERHEWRLHSDPSACLFLPEATVLLVGAGAIGARVAELLAPFGPELIATDARLTAPPPPITQLYPPEALHDLLSQVDAVVVSVPHTPDTDRLFDKATFKRMKPGMRFVNVGRGPVVDVDALVDAMGEGLVAGAALDVFPEEPLPADHPFWSLPGALVTPHSAGVGPGSDERRYQVLAENARRFGAGQPLLNIVDKKLWF